MNEEHIKSLYLEEKAKWDEGKEQGLVKGEFMPFYVFVQAGGFIGNTEETRQERLNSLSKQLNGGKNSGNHNPGQEQVD